MFYDLENAVKARINEGNSESTEGGIKRLSGNSPSRLTPNSKKIKDIPQQVQEPREPKGRSRTSLSQLKADWTERESLEGAIANLMFTGKNNKGRNSVQAGREGKWFFFQIVKF